MYPGCTSHGQSCCTPRMTVAQEGFRRYRNTSRQLQMAILMIEDAALYNQDIYSLYIDFSSAFNTVNHKQLILIMQKLGFPNTAIKAVENTYTNACTRIQTPHGETEDLQIGRGTIQGDTLSPYHNFHVHLDPINPDFDIVPSGRPTIPCRRAPVANPDCLQEARTSEPR